MITKSKFMHLMRIPNVWEELGMYPDALFEVQLENFDESHVQGSEHDRNGMFHWWLRNTPSKQQLIKLARLIFLVTDQLMAADVRTYLRKAENADEEVLSELRENA